MHICILADPVDNQNAGVHVYTKNLISALLKIDTKNRYSLIHRRPNGFFLGTEHYIIPYKKRLGYESYRKFILVPQRIKKLNPDIVLEPAHMGPFRIPKHIKRATIIHDLTPILFPQFHIRKSVRNHKIFLPRIIKNADLILTPSQSTKQDILNNYQTNAHIHRIHAGLTKKTAKQSLPTIPPPFPYFLYLGTLEPRKNIPTLIDAFTELKKEHNIPHKLILAGKIGWKAHPTLQKLTHPDILTKGFITEEDKHHLFKHATGFIYPSFYEGFGLPPLEAMSHGLPVICAKSGSLLEIFSDHALMFYPQDKNTLKKHILDLIQDPQLRQKLRSQGLKFATSFNWENSAHKLLKHFQQVVKQESS